MLDPEAGEALDAQTGQLTSGKAAAGGHKRNGDMFRNTYSAFGGTDDAGELYGDTGGASRFFYCAKASRGERNAGLEGFDAQQTQPYNERPSGGLNAHLHGEDPAPRANVHPTVKPIALMRWLVRMVTPPGGTVLDPFNGSGSTGCAAVLEGFDYIGIEREAEYVAIAEARIKWWAEHPEGVELAERVKAEKLRAEVEAAGQESLFGEAA